MVPFVKPANWDPLEKRLTSKTVCKVAGCEEVTFRAWRNRGHKKRIGLFPETTMHAKGRRTVNLFSAVEATAVKLVTELTARGLFAAAAISAANDLLPELREVWTLYLTLDDRPEPFTIALINYPSKSKKVKKSDEKENAATKSVTLTIGFTDRNDTIGSILGDFDGFVFAIDLLELVRQVFKKLAEVESQK